MTLLLIAVAAVAGLWFFARRAHHAARQPVGGAPAEHPRHCC